MPFDPRLFGAVFAVIFMAELPDKTALAALVLATRYRPLPVFVGAALALTVQSAVAVAAGGLLSLLPARPIHVGAGLLFLVSAVLMWRRREDADRREGRECGRATCTHADRREGRECGRATCTHADRREGRECGRATCTHADRREASEARAGEPSFGRALASAFGVVFVAEWGDLTQLGTAALAARYKSPLLVFSAATAALWAVTGIAVAIGNRAGAWLKPATTQKVAAVVFALLGAALVAGIL